MDKFNDFYQKINYKFKNPNLLMRALTHPSIKSKANNLQNYERLEFLGDKVLSLVIAEFLMEKYPEYNEGSLSKTQAKLISGPTLTLIANKIDLASMLILSNGELKIGGSFNKNNLENALEALIGAIYQDSDFVNAKKFILNFWQDFLKSDNLDFNIDYISNLQEIIQAKFKKLPIYLFEKIGGSEHAPIFQCTIKIKELDLEFKEKGNSKKIAQKNVAKKALEFLKNQDL